MAGVEREEPGNPETLEWQLWPAAQRPVISVAVVALALVLAWVAIWSFGSAWYGFITLLVLAMALASHYFPTTYHLDEARVVTRGGAGNVEREWEAFRLAVDLGDRIVLSPLSDPRKWLARRRSVTLLLAGNHDEVLAFVARHVAVRPEQP